MQDFTKDQVGTRVWSFVNGWGTITEIDRSKPVYPVLVHFDTNTDDRFTPAGLSNKLDSYPTLFYDEIKYTIPPKPLPRLEIDTKVIVWDFSNEKYKRYFSHFGEDGRIRAFKNGATSWSEIVTFPYANWELAEN